MHVATVTQATIAKGACLGLGLGLGLGLELRIGSGIRLG